MNKFLWISLLFGFIAGPVKAQEILSRENNHPRFSLKDIFNSDNSAPNANSTTEEKLCCTANEAPLTGKEKLRYMLRSTYEVKSVVFSLSGAGIKQARDSVPEWGQGMEGYGKRLASSFGHKIIKRNIQFGFNILLHEDPRYFYSEKTGIWERTLYAASRTFVSNKDAGGIRFGYSKFVSTFAGAYISRQWYPERKQKLIEYFESFAISLGVDTAKNVFNEFWPDVKRLIRR